MHPLIKPNIFLGDDAFDTMDIYKDLLEILKFNKAYIPLNQRASLKNSDCTINADSIPCCPNDNTLLIKPEDNTSHLRIKIPTFKFVYQKMKWNKFDDGKYRRRLNCKNPCTSSPSGRMIYVYPEKTFGPIPEQTRHRNLG